MTKDELENELTGTKAMLSATEKQLAETQAANIALLDQVQALEANALDFEFLLQQGLQLDYDMRTLRYRATISQYVLQNHRKIEYVEGRGNGAAETNYDTVNEALQAFVKGV